MLGNPDSNEEPKNRQKSEASPDVAFDGLSIEDYAGKFGLAEAEVWRRLRRGELVGRTQKGRLLIYLTPEAAQAATAAGAQEPLGAAFEDVEAEDAAEHPDLAFLPPLPGADAPHAGKAGATAAGGFLTLSGDRTSSPELALLLDHLSLAKEENREILRMTQESIRKVTELSEALVEMKDSVIEAKDSELARLKEQLEARDKEMRRLKQQNEDLEMLARSMATQTGK